MSLGISISTPEGIVLAADSRQSYLNKKGVSRVGSDSASKVFKLSNSMGVIAAGPAFIADGEGINKNISKYIEDFSSEIKKDATVQEVSIALQEFFSQKYQYKKILLKQQKKIVAQLKTEGASSINLDPKEEEGRLFVSFRDKKGKPQNLVVGVDVINLLLSGYNKDGSHGSYIIRTPGTILEKRNSKKKNLESGAEWIGQTDVISRIVLGFDGRIQGIPIFHELMNQKGADVFNKSIRGLEYSIQWATMTLQDAIDFCILMIKTTTAIQRFSDGIAADPGDVPGVGGAVDVAILTERGFVWAQKKKLHIDTSEIDLDKI